MPVEIEVIEPFVKRTRDLPARAAARRLPAPRRRPGRCRRSRAAPSVRLLVRYLDALALELGALDEPGRAVAADAALELLRAAVAPSVPIEPRRPARRDVRRGAPLHPRPPAGRVARARESIAARPRDVGARAARPVRGQRRVGLRADPPRAPRPLPRGPRRCPSGGSVTEIAFRWGFHDAAHFARVFKAHYELHAERGAPRGARARRRGRRRAERGGGAADPRLQRRGSSRIFRCALPGALSAGRTPRPLRAARSR